MYNLIKAEFYKLINSYSYKIILLSIIGFGIGLSIISTKDGYFAFTNSSADIFTHSIFTSIFTASFIGGEYINHTYERGFYCGSSHKKVFLSKLVVFLIGLQLLLFTYSMTTVAAISVKNGFGRELDIDTYKEFLVRILYCLIWYLALGSFFALISTFVRNKIGIILIGILGCYIVGYVLVYYEETNKAPDILKYILLYQVRLFFFDWESVSHGIFIGLSAVTIIMSIIISVIIFEKKDFK